MNWTILFCFICVIQNVIVLAAFSGVHSIYLDPSGSFGNGVVLARSYQILFITCEVATLDKNIRITWEHNFEIIRLPPPYVKSWEHGSLLYVRPVIKGKTDGFFECIVKAGSRVYRKGVRVTVKEDADLPDGFPSMLQHPANVHTRRDSVDFSCVVSGSPPVKIRWYRNAFPVQDDSNHQISYLSLGNTSYTSNLRVKNAAIATRGFYRCAAGNVMGQAVSSQANIRFFRQRRYTEISGGPIYNGNCTVYTTKKNHAGHVTLDTIRAPCINTEDLGHHFIIQWLPPEGAVNNKISSYRVTLRSSNGRYWCFHPKAATLEFSPNSSMTYEVAITTEPAPENFTVDLKGIGRCPVMSISSTIDTKLGTSAPTAQKKINAEVEDNHLGQILGGVGAGCVALIVLVVIRYSKANNGKSKKEKTDASSEVYISYACGSSDKDEKRVLKLATYLSQYGIKVCIDLCKTVEISEMGGLSNWVPSKLHEADKILVILSPMYLKALNPSEDDCLRDDICRINTEFNYIKSILYHTCQQPRNLVIVLDGIKKDDLPDVLKGRITCQFPKELKEQYTRRLLGLILGIEPRQINDTPVET